MVNLRDLLRKKGNQVWSVAPQATVYEALQLMAEKNAGALLVMQDEKVVGILSERDIVRKVELKGQTSRQTQVQDIMTSKVLYAEAGQSLEECMAVMIDKGIRHLPIYDGNELVGLISVRDVLKEMVDQQKFMISQLEHYISGARS